MDGHHHDYYYHQHREGDGTRYGQPDGWDARHHLPAPAQIPSPARVADSVGNAHRLLASYPMASATPSTHVARHIANFAFTPSASSFMQPHMYHAPYPPTNPPPYTEYAYEVEYLATQQGPIDEFGYWQGTRNDSVHLLAPQIPFSSLGHSETFQWSGMPAPMSNYRTNAFARSIFQHFTPATAYPTPPPPGISRSSSSLAHALGDPVSQQCSPAYGPEDSTVFFDKFLTQHSRDLIPAPVRSPPAPQRRSEPSAQDSPDPLALLPSTPNVYTATTTPRKRKLVVEIESPYFKRVHSADATRASTIPPSHPPGSNTRKTLAYVEVPPLPMEWRTPSSKHKSRNYGRLWRPNHERAHDDLGGYGSEVDSSPSRVNVGGDARSARRTGERDDRAPLEKITTLLDDIFEAEDALAPDADLSDLPAEFFSRLSADCAHPLLQRNLVRKLSKYVDQVARPTKRLRLSNREGNVGGGSTPRHHGRMAEIDAFTLSRLLKMLHRSVRLGEDLDPFVNAHEKVATPRKSIGHNVSQNKADKLEEHHGQHNYTMLEGPSEASPQITGLPDTDLDHLITMLDVARDSILAADCCIALLGSDRLTKELYSEEVITSCLSTVKNQLTKIVYPFVDTSGDTANVSPLLQHLIKNHTSSQTHRRQLSELFQALSSVLLRITNLISAETVVMSDSIIIQAVYIAIGPFFVVDAGVDGEGKGKKDNIILSTLGASAMRGLRMNALSLIRGIFANHDDQRSWIIEEILTSLIKLSDTKQKAGQFRLRDGRSIHTVSALLLQLVQTSSHDVRMEARMIEKARHQTLAPKEYFHDQEAGRLCDEQDAQVIHLYASGLDSATKVAKTIILFLTQRSGRGKATKNSNEAEYRAIFYNLVNDLLTVLHWPEWPAAGLLLSIACKYMVSSLDDVKSSHKEDSNAAKAIALEHLGVIAARIRASMLKWNASNEQSACLKSLDEIIATLDVNALDQVLAIHNDVITHLCKRASEDQAYDSARELASVTLAQELAIALKQLNVCTVSSDEVLKRAGVDGSNLLVFRQKLKAALRDVWKDPDIDVFDMSSQDDVVWVDRRSEEAGMIHGFKNSFQPILNVILAALDAPPIFMRTKALRALNQIVISDPDILSALNVRQAIESHLLDSSPAVRDVAVELIGKSIVDSPEVAGCYYQKIADRIADTGLVVRKRVIKLLKTFYSLTEDSARRVDIVTRLVLRMGDEDDTVKELAIRTVEELWFNNYLSQFSSQKSKELMSLQTTHDKSPLLEKVVVIMGVSANFKDRQSPLEDLLHKLMADKEGNEATSLHARYAEICEALIDGLVDASDLPGFTVINCIRTIHLFASAHPAMLSGSNLSTLLPYLKSATNVEEQATSDYLLRIFRTSIPHIPKTAAKFGHELQLALQPMILKPSTIGGLQSLQESVACMCAVVASLTHDFTRLVALLKSCDANFVPQARLRQAICRPPTHVLGSSETRALSVLVFIVSSLGEHCDFDKLRLEDNVIASELNNIATGSIIEHLYHSLTALHERYEDSAFRGRVLQCLGFLFRAQPTLMTLERSAAIMDSIFASSEDEGHGRVLKILQEFLVSEATKHSALEKVSAKRKAHTSNVNMEELVGNTDGFADSGVSSAIVQRYLGPILDAALSQNFQLQAAAIDVLSFTIRQGLAHPLQSFPVIVALETSPNTVLSTRSSALHAILHSKHTSLLNSRYLISAKASFDYQHKLGFDPIQGYRMQPFPTALLQRWYSLVREKRSSRQDFLKALVKVFDMDVELRAAQEDVDFVRYMAENFSALDYKTQEEVFSVIKHLTSVLSTAGMQLVEVLSPSHLLTQLHRPLQPVITPDISMSDVNLSPQLQAEPLVVAPPDIEPGPEQISMVRRSVVVGIAMILKNYLKRLYGLSEEKCSKHVLGKKTVIGDRPAVKRNQLPISWDRLPFATAPLLTAEDAEMQKNIFLDIWNEDGLVIEEEEPA